MTELKRFLELAQRGKFFHSAWITCGPVHCYVRHSHRVIPPFNGLADTLDIATVDIDPKYQNKGYFKEFLAEAMKLNPWPCIYIENVLTPRFADHFIKSGWTRDERYPSDFCFYQLNGQTC